MVAHNFQIVVTLFLSSTNSKPKLPQNSSLVKYILSSVGINVSLSIILPSTILPAVFDCDTLEVIKVMGLASWPSVYKTVRSRLFVTSDFNPGIYD